MTPRESKLLASNYTPTVIEKMRKDWSAKEMASALDMRIREIEKIGDLTFLEMGLCVMEFERNEKLWAELGYATFTSWMNSGRVKGSRAKRYASLAAVKAMLEINVPLEEAGKLPRGALQTLSAVPKQHRGKFFQAAAEMEVNALRGKIQQECPEAHLEPYVKMTFKFETSQQRKVQEAIEVAMVLYELPSREAACEVICADWLNSNQTEADYAAAEQAMAAHV